MRPAVCLMVASIYSDNIKNALPLAYALEMFHNFTLLHDDIMDDADIRRSKPTVHSLYGQNTAILSGDLMMIKSFQYILNSKLTENNRIKILDLFTKTAIEVCEGQQYDMDFESEKYVNTDSYLKMIELKTAVLLASAFKIGAIAGGADENIAELWYSYGINVGMAFQVQDDYLDIFGDQELFGKLNGGDIIQKKKTYPFLIALEQVVNKEQLIIDYNSDFDNPQDKVSHFQKIYNDLEIPRLVQEKIQYYDKKAIENLDSISSNKNELQEIIDLHQKLMNRGF
ncbi:MAG: polyprenyl synthetase family protein [Saprospiraceae bacterium]